MGVPSSRSIYAQRGTLFGSSPLCASSCRHFADSLSGSRAAARGPLFARDPVLSPIQHLEHFSHEDPVGLPLTVFVGGIDLGIGLVVFLHRRHQILRFVGRPADCGRPARRAWTPAGGASMIRKTDHERFSIFMSSSGSIS